MKKLLVLISTFTLALTTNAGCDKVKGIVDSVLPGGDNTDNTVEIEDKEDIVLFGSLTEGMEESLPEYLKAPGDMEVMFEPDSDKQWTSGIAGVKAPFIAEVHGDVANAIWMQNIVTTINMKAASVLDRMGLSFIIVPAYIPLVGTFQISMKLIHAESFEDTTMKYGIETNFKYSKFFVPWMNYSVKTYFQETEAELCTHSAIEATAISLGPVNAAKDTTAITTCHDAQTRKWTRTRTMKNKTKATVINTSNTVTEIIRNDEGIHLAMAKSTLTGEAKRLVKIDNNGYSYSYSSSKFRIEEINSSQEFQAADEHGNLFYQASLNGSNFWAGWNSKWYMYGIDGWDSAQYQNNFSLLPDEFRINWSNGEVSQWKYDITRDLPYFMNGKDKLQGYEYDAENDEYIKVEKTIYPYIYQESSATNTDPFALPTTLFYGTSRFQSYVSNTLPGVKDSFEMYNVEGEQIFNHSVSISNIVKRIINKFL